ncbi:hypothetical protein [Deminuibacter soli]|uniref:Uncharacterized protein n=1 Tax=Deminuibacter soli TaxID=2291815 RepID=A0A3E1NK25_9BACT|nr:hypothetical protein [Deminuibacter soli]RFM28289.1 hypothetical protein DXN05_12310 [Deminuibacter soli]
MLLFNSILLIHFALFVYYIFRLALQFPVKNPVKDKSGPFIGLAVLVTGLALVALKYPAINYYKVIPKTALLVGIAIVNGMYGNKPMPRKAYFTVLGFTLLAAAIAVVKV